MEVDKIDVDKLKTVLVDFSKLSNVVENEIVKKSVSDKLVAKLDAFYTIKLVLRSKYDTENLNLENKLMTLTKNYLMLVRLLKKQIIMIKLLKQKENYVIFLV